MMRGSDGRSGSLFSYVDLEARIRRNYPLRTIREMANASIGDLSGEFAVLYPARLAVLYPARLGRPSTAPERLLRAMHFMGHALMENRNGLAVGGRHQLGDRHGRAREGAAVKRAASSPSIASPAPFTAPATATTSRATELQVNGSLEGEICSYNGDDISFIVSRLTSSTACQKVQVPCSLRQA